MILQVLTSVIETNQREETRKGGVVGQEYTTNQDNYTGGRKISKIEM